MQKCIYKGLCPNLSTNHWVVYIMDMLLRYARGISYSQLYKEGTDTIEELIKGLPTCESVMCLSFLVHNKITQTLDENDYNIICSLLFKFTNELRDKILEYMGPVGRPLDQYIDVHAMLETIECLLKHQNNDRHDLSNDEFSRLFKAYLIVCDTYTEKEVRIGKNGEYSSEDMLKYYMPIALRMNKLLTIKDPLIELVKSKLFLIDFASDNKQFSKYIDTYLKEKGCGSASEYIQHLYLLSTLLITNKERSNVFKLEYKDIITIGSFLDNFCINTNDEIEVNIQERPLYKVDERTYCVIYNKFFVDKFFHSMLFDIAKVLERKKHINTSKTPAYVQLKQLVGQKFTEQYLFYNIVDRILADKRYEKKTGEEMSKIGDGFPDFYAKKVQRVFLFEFKDIQLSRKVTLSGDFEVIIKALERELVVNDKGRPKGVTQLANNIENKLQELVGESINSQRIQVYPVLVYSDSSFDIEGFNYYLNTKFREIISNREIPDNIIVKDLIMINIDALILFEKAFIDKTIKFDVLINEFLSFKESKEQYKVVPFNKFLFQKAKQKGCYYKASYIVNKILSELAENINNHGYSKGNDK